MSAPSYSAVVLHDQPLVYWRLGEPSGTVAADASGHSHPGTYTGAPTLAQPGLVVGDADTAVSMAAITDYVIAAAHVPASGPTPYPNGCAVEAMVRVDGLPIEAYPVLMSSFLSVGGVRLVVEGTENVIVDGSGNGRDGTVPFANDLARTIFRQPGIIDLTHTDFSIGLDESGISVPIAAGTFAAGDFTIGGWFDSTLATGTILLGLYRGTLGFSNLLQITYTPGAGFRLVRFYDGANNQDYSFPGTLTAGRHFWALRHVEATGVTSLFVDNAARVDVTLAAHAMTTAELATGTLCSGTGYGVEGMFICPSAVSNADVAGLYTAAAVGFSSWETAVLALTPSNLYECQDAKPGLHVRFDYDDHTGFTWSSGPGFPTQVGDRHHYVGQFDPVGGAQLFVDGELYESSATGAGLSAVVPNLSFFLVGGEFGSAAQAYTVDEPAFYDHLLSTDRIAIHGAIAFGVAPFAKLSPVVRLVTARALVVPHQIERWVLPVICTSRVEIGPGEYIEQSQDVQAIRDFFTDLRRNGTVVPFQEGNVRHMVVVRDVSFAEGSVERWGVQRNGLQGTLLVTIDSVGL